MLINGTGINIPKKVEAKKPIILKPGQELPKELDPKDTVDISFNGDKKTKKEDGENKSFILDARSPEIIKYKSAKCRDFLYSEEFTSEGGILLPIHPEIITELDLPSNIDLNTNKKEVPEDKKKTVADNNEANIKKESEASKSEALNKNNIIEESPTDADIMKNIAAVDKNYEYLWMMDAPAPFKYTGKTLYQTGAGIYNVAQHKNIRENLYTFARSGRKLDLLVRNARTLEDVSTAVSGTAAVGTSIMLHALTGVAALGGVGLMLHGSKEIKRGNNVGAISAFSAGTASLSEATSGIIKATGILGANGMAIAGIAMEAASVFGCINGALEIGLGGKELIEGIKEKKQDKIVNGSLKALIGGSLITAIATGGVVPILAGLTLVGGKLIYNYREELGKAGKKVIGIFKKKDKEESSIIVPSHAETIMINKEKEAMEQKKETPDIVTMASNEAKEEKEMMEKKIKLPL